MIKRILVPTDFSDCAFNALQYAVRLKADIKAEGLFVMHAYTIPVPYSDVGIASVDALMTQQQEEIDHGMTTLKSKIPELKEADVRMVSRQQLAVDGILNFCQEENIDLIIMGTTGASGLGEIMMGTITHAVIRSVNIPVLVVPEVTRYHRPRTIALASDYQGLDVRLLKPLKLFNKIYGAGISIVHIEGENKLDHDEAEEARKLERYFKDIPHRYHFIVANDVGKTIEAFTKKHDVDILAIVPRKHTFFERLFKKSNSRQLIFHASTPLLALPETQRL